MRRIVLLVLFSLLASGCSLVRSSNELRSARELGLLAGGVQGVSSVTGLRVALFTRPEETWELAGLCSLSEVSDLWSFALMANQDYAVAVYRDLDASESFTPGEPWGALGLDAPMRVSAGTRVVGMTLSLDEKGAPPEVLTPFGFLSARSSLWTMNASRREPQRKACGRPFRRWGRPVRVSTFSKSSTPRGSRSSSFTGSEAHPAT